MSGKMCSFAQLHSTGNPRRTARQRGVALLITLGLLAMLGAASLAIIYLTSSDALINGYYRNYRGSFYAADSGANIVTEAMRVAIAHAASPGVNAPLPISTAVPTPAQLANGAMTGAASTSSFTSSYAPYLASYFIIGDSQSWNSQFKMISGGFLPTATYSVQCNPSDLNCFCEPGQSCCASGSGCVATPCPSGVSGTCYSDADYQWNFSYPYSITIQGESSGGENEQITETGVVKYSSTLGTGGSGGLPSFAQFAGFIDQFSLCQGALVPGTMYGPFFTNGSWNFGNFNPGYTFENSIGQAGSKVGYMSGWGCSQGGATPPRGYNISFKDGFNIGANPIQPPSDSYNQEQAVLDGTGAAPCTANPCGNGQRTPPSQALMSSILHTVNGTAYPSSGSAPNGVYIPYFTSGGQAYLGSQNLTTGGVNPAGGFYINGNASITLTATSDTAGHPTQTYSITQGSTTTNIVVDASTNTTTVNSGTSTITMQGIPEQVNPNTGAAITQTDPNGSVVNPAMVYVNGQVTGLSGTVQNDTGITLTATSNVSITGNVTYVSQPVTSSDQLVSTTNAGVLGIYTPADVNLDPPSNGANLTIDASIAMLSGQTNGTAGLETPRNSVGTLTIMGGRSEDQAHGVNISTGNTMFDQRFAGNFGPPWFPTAQPTAASAPILQSYSATIQRTGWSENRQ